MIDTILASSEPLNTWLVDSSGNIAASGAGLALLEAEITHFDLSASEESIRLRSSEGGSLIPIDKSLFTHA